jgi:methylated-DNA-[protein]-cysteine S-methyltransferase
MTTPTFSTRIDSPIGPLLLDADGDVLVGIWLPPAPRRPTGALGDAPSVLREAARQLGEYFAGERQTFEVPTRLDGTGFQRQVWLELTRIPYGHVVSYGELARRVGRPGAARAVGGANARNPVPIIVPCHRVVASDGIGGYGGGVPMKEALLDLEGAWSSPSSLRSSHARRGR